MTVLTWHQCTTNARQRRPPSVLTWRRLIQPAHHPITSHQAAAGRRNKTIVRRRQDIERYIGSPIFLHHCCIWLPRQQSFRGCCDKNRACRESILINIRTLAGICDQRGGQMEELHTRWPGNKQGDREKIPPVTFCSKCSICGCVHCPSVRKTSGQRYVPVKKLLE